MAWMIHSPQTMIALTDYMPDALGALLRRQPLSDAKVAFAWRTAVGTTLARYSSVHLDADGCLVVTVEDPQWRAEIRRISPMIRPRLEAWLGRGAMSRMDVRAPSGRARSPR